MIDNEWGLSFAKYLVKILDGQKKIELQRQILGSVKEFEPYSTFMRLDREKKNYLTENDFKVFLREMNVRFSDRYLKEVIKFYDKDKDGCLNFEEFLKLVLTFSDDDLRADITQRRNYTVNKKDYLINQIEENFTLLLLKEFELAEEILFKANSFRYFRGVDKFKIFRSIDYLNYNCLDKQELSLFLKKYGFFVTDAEIDILIGRLDIDCDGYVSQEDFQEVFFSFPRNSINLIQNDYKTDSNYNYRNLDKKIIKTRYVRSPLRGSVGLRASQQSYTSPKQEISSKEKKQTFSGSCIKENKDKSRNSPYSEKTLSSSTRFSDISHKEERFQNYEIKIDYESIITNFLLKLITLEDKLQSIKETFCLREFNLKQLFKIFDPYTKGYATLSDFNKGLKTLNIYSSGEDFRMLFKRYDTNRDGVLSFSEFLQMIAPLKNEYAKLLSNRISNSLSHHNRPTEEFSKLIKLLIETEYQIETIRNLSTNNPYFILSDAFEVFKGEYGYLKNYIIKEDVRFIIKKIDLFVS